MDTQERTDTELFDDAFNEAVAPPSDDKELPAVGAVTEGDAKDSGTDATPSEGTDAPASADAAGASTPAADKAIEGGTPAASEDATVKVGDPPAKAEDLAPAPAPDYGRQTVELLDKLVNKGTSPGPADAAQPTAQPPATSQDQGGAEPESFKLSDEQTALLKTFDDEWPEIAKASALRTQMAVQTAVGALIKQLRTELAPIVTQYVKTAGDSHLGSIRDAHKDFDTLKPKVLEWIGKQPAGLRNAYKAVAAQGSAEDVIQLFDTYKKVNGLGTPAAVAEPADASVITVKTPAPEVKKAADSLAVIPGRRSVVPRGGVDKSDFDGGWNAAIGS